MTNPGRKYDVKWKRILMRYQKKKTSVDALVMLAGRILDLSRKVCYAPTRALLVVSMNGLWGAPMSSKLRFFLLDCCAGFIWLFC